MANSKTSTSHPIRVDWLATPWSGRVGLTFAPGKRDLDARGGPWERDIDSDMRRLREEYEVTHLVCLVEDHELEMLRIERLPAAAEQAGIALIRLPIVDLSIPEDHAALAQVVSNIAGWAAAGSNVVIHCRGGLGRSGLVGGCVLRAAGFDGASALAELAEARSPNCPETDEQRRYVEMFSPVADTRARIAGAVLGAAIGDALGHPTEFLKYPQLEAKYGPGGVKQFELWWERDAKRFAPYTDDTQMAEIVLGALVQNGRAPEDFDAVMEAMAAGFAKWTTQPQGGHRAPGNSCMAGSRRLAAGVPWREAGGADAGGCGSVMRAYPFGMLLHDDLERAEHWAVEHSRMTHQAPIALAACAAMAVGMAHEMNGAPAGEVLTSMVDAAGRHDVGTASMCGEAVRRAEAGDDPVAVLHELQGWSAHEAIAAAMFVVARHPSDIRGALLEGANASGDSDSIATLAGALLGARLGIDLLPQDWIRDVERSEELRALAAEAVTLMEA